MKRDILQEYGIRWPNIDYVQKIDLEFVDSFDNMEWVLRDFEKKMVAQRIFIDILIKKGAIKKEHLDKNKKLRKAFLAGFCGNSECSLDNWFERAK